MEGLRPRQVLVPDARQRAPAPRILDADPGQRRVQVVAAVHEPRAGLHLVTNRQGRFLVRGPDRGGEPEGGVIHETDRFRVRFHLHDSSHRPENFFLHHRHRVIDPEQDLRREIRRARLGVTEVQLAAELLPLLDTLAEPVNYADVTARQDRLHRYFATCSHTISGDKIKVRPADLGRDLAAKADWLTAHLRQHEWVTDRAGYGWFNGYYDNDGQRVEGDGPHGVRMTLTGQVFALMGGIASAAQAQAIVRSADRYLYEHRLGGYRLNTDFGGMQFNLGRCFGFAFGHKENGAMFSHMAVMYANALYRRGLVREGFRVLDGIYQHCADFATARIYPGLPEYISERGRGLYPWLTGSASWYLLTLLNEVFGVRGELGDLVLAPKLVAAQFDERGQAAVAAQFAGRQIEIVYHNPRRLEFGAYAIRRIAADGVDLSGARVDQGVRIAREVIAALGTPAALRLDIELDEG